MFYINLFFIYSFLGFIFENIISFIGNTNFNSGVLYGPWTFIYAIGMFLIVLLGKFLNQFKINKVLKVIIFFCIACILMTLVEYSGGMLIEILFHRVYWDYTSYKFNYGHYISLVTSLLWGLFATLIYYFVHPHIESFAKKIPKWLTIIVLGLFIIDVIASLVN